jgi:hypothetical protein
MLNPTDSSTRKPRELSSEEEKMVAFLTDRKLALPKKIDFAKMTEEDFIEAETIAAERNMFWDEFASPSPEVLLIRYARERSRVESDGEIVFERLSAAQAAGNYPPLAHWASC